MYSGVLVHTGALQFIDTSNPGGRGFRWRGETPWLVPKPWRFSTRDIPKLDGQVVVVTGANSGMGFWTASHLAENGATVVLGCRNSTKCAAAAKQIGGKSVPMTLDLARFDSITQFASEFKSTYSRLDALVLNAGVMLLPWGQTVDRLETTMAINYVGHFLLTKLLLPVSEATASEHGVATVSVHSSAAMYENVQAGGIDMRLLEPQSAPEAPGWFGSFETYCQSKLATVLFAQELAQREKDAGRNVLVNSHAPGAVRTNLIGHIINPGGTLEQKAGSAVRWAVDWMLWLLLSQLVWDPRDACLNQVFTAVSDEVREGKVTGKYFQSVAREQLPDPHAANATLQTLLWESTEALLAEYDLEF